MGLSSGSVGISPRAPTAGATSMNSPSGNPSLGGKVDDRIEAKRSNAGVDTSCGIVSALRKPAPVALRALDPVAEAIVPGGPVLREESAECSTLVKLYLRRRRAVFIHEGDGLGREG
eukprot:CAMPEP_0177753060 /NCGR_PEP_ID=MMETSP0491_2-20121128/1251_1 /TAXON_ID=63592 /ORGANISM="Tetraselmis chuii, Strain PLY429" /LENGTH=116 /DNA_ID=CAMNT_0019268305 /DNA_START=126 /DNA_END=471 /DNA_ORIENTATION=-